MVRELVDPTYPIAELHAAALDKRVDPILAGSAVAMAVGPRTVVRPGPTRMRVRPLPQWLAISLKASSLEGRPQSSNLVWPVRP